MLLLYPGFFGKEELKNRTSDLLIRETNEQKEDTGTHRHLLSLVSDTKAQPVGPPPGVFLLYSTDMSSDMSEHRQEGTRILGASNATQVFRPMWSAWPEVSSLQTVAAEEQLRALSRAAEGIPHRARELASSMAAPIKRLASSSKVGVDG